MSENRHRTALVVGATGGLGSSVALLLSQLGYFVGVCYRRKPSEAEALVASLPGPATSIYVDVLDWESIRVAVRTLEELGPICVAVNCAGVMTAGLLVSQNMVQWRDCVEVNLLGAYLVCRAVLPRMLRRRQGKIIMFASPAGIVASPGQTAYSASKAAIIELTRSLAVECAPRNVTINAVSPGFVETEMTAHLAPGVREKIVEHIPLGRAGTPVEIVSAVRFIVESDYVTGQNICIDGGIGLRGTP